MTLSKRQKKRFFVSRVRHKPTPPNSSFQAEHGFRVEWQINPHMKMGASHLSVAEEEHKKFTETLVACGAEVSQVDFIPGAYDSVFMKDDVVMLDTSDGLLALLTKPSTPERQNEPTLRASELEAQGLTITGQCDVHLEGGDIVFSAEKNFAFMGYGFRSDRKAVEHLADFLECEVHPLELKDPYFYHLDTALNLTCVDGKCIAFAYPEAFTAEAWQCLTHKFEIDDVVCVSRDEALNFALNWVEVDGSIILGSDVPETKKKLEQMGKRVLVRKLSQFQLAGGSAACLVAAVHSLN